MPEATEVVPEEAEAPKPSAPETTEPPAEPFKAVRGTCARHSLPLTSHAPPPPSGRGAQIQICLSSDRERLADGSRRAYEPATL